MSRQRSKHAHYEVWLQAKHLRSDLARSFRPKAATLKKYSKYLKDSFLESLTERDPSNLNESTLLFSLAVSDLAVTYLLEKDLSWPERLTRIGQVVELGARVFLNPADPSKSVDNLAASKDQGYFFTPRIIAEKMVSLTKQGNRRAIGSVLDPACGVGTLLGFSMLGLPDLRKVVGVENDKFTAAVARRVLRQLTRDLGKRIELEILQQNGVDFLLALETNTQGFDAVIMNPPYGQIRHLRSSLSDKQTASTLKCKELELLHTRIRESTIEASQRLKTRLSYLGIGKGTPEYSKVFLRLAMEAIKQGGRLVAITPATWLGDNTSTELRRFLFQKNQLRSIISFKETTKLFQTVNQHTAIASIEIGTTGDGFDLIPEVDSVSDLQRRPTRVDVKMIQAISPTGLRIANLDATRSSILAKLHRNGCVGSCSEIANLRGECDLTMFKRHIRVEHTTSRLIRGDHIKRFQLLPTTGSEKAGFVDRKGFEIQIGNTSKLQHSTCWRIAVPQCSYIQQKRRLAFCLVPPGSIMANSANYLFFSSVGGQFEESVQARPPSKLLALLGILNSSVVEWRFRIFNSNNHVGNYEIDEIPIPPDYNADSGLITDVEKLVRLLTLGKDVERAGLLNLSIEARVARAFDLDQDELKLILADIRHDRTDELLTIFEKFADSTPSNKRQVWNHALPNLSALDRKIISYVPRGGNWQNIPESVPSQRLKQIREMTKERGVVRTTYYGRLRPDQPSYTIATYYNRPGNGTNIHPFEDRTLTSREAARLQSFPDSFKFFGSEGAVRKQIGNAVPPLLGYAVGRLFKPTTCVDLFCGAGGLSYGMSLAGHRVIAALDNNKDAIETFHKNHSTDAVTICDDITKEEVREDFIQRIKIQLGRERLGLLVGGPPCQGFSTAGWRKADDQRNGLISNFLRIAEALKPSAICIENVEGLLSMNNGRVVRDIQKVIRGMGYSFHDEPWLLRAEEFGVPQMRRRVMIVAARESKKLPDKPIAVCISCKGRREIQADRVGQLKPYPTTVLEALLGLPGLSPEKRDMTKEEALNSRPHYSNWCNGRISVDKFHKLLTDQAPGALVDLNFRKFSQRETRRAQPVKIQKIIQPSLLDLV